jgi:hypothetical protein
MRKINRISAIFLITAILCNLTIGAAAAGLGNVTHESELPLSDHLVYKSVESEDDGGRLQSYIFEYEPYSAIIPQVVYGTRLYGKSTVAEASSYIEK